MAREVLPDQLPAVVVLAGLFLEALGSAFIAPVPLLGGNLAGQHAFFAKGADGRPQRCLQGLRRA